MILLSNSWASPLFSCPYNLTYSSNAVRIILSLSWHTWTQVSNFLNTRISSLLDSDWYHYQIQTSLLLILFFYINFAVVIYLDGCSPSYISTCLNLVGLSICTLFRSSSTFLGRNNSTFTSSINLDWNILDVTYHQSAWIGIFSTLYHRG
jgi:hypothetical protein